MSHLENTNQAIDDMIAKGRPGFLQRLRNMISSNLSKAPIGDIHKLNSALDARKKIDKAQKKNK